MTFRLGEFECEQCGHVITAQDPSAEPKTSGPGFRQPWQPAAPASGADRGKAWPTHAPPAAPPPVSPAPYSRSSTPPGVFAAPPKYDPAPTLNTEKTILIGVFLLKAVVNVLSVAAQPVDPELAQIGVSPVLAQMGSELVHLGLLAAVIFIPFVPLKYGCAFYSCCVGTGTIVMLILSAILMQFIGLFFAGLLPGFSSALSAGSTLPAVAGWILGLLNAGVNLWLASALFRDIQKIQAE